MRRRILKSLQPFWFICSLISLQHARRSEAAGSIDSSSLPSMPVSARNLIRKMRGGAQSHLIAGEDGAQYVVKFTNNPQHRRILINEWLANALSSLSTNPRSPNRSDSGVGSFSGRESRTCISRWALVANARLPGLHFGSKMSVNPDKVAVFDFLPESCLARLKTGWTFWER